MIPPVTASRQKFAWWVSIIGNPLSVAILAFAALLIIGSGLAGGRQAAGLTTAIFFASALPTGFTYTLVRLGKVATLDVDDRRKRLAPLLVGSFSYLIGFYLLSTMDMPLAAQGLMFCYFTNTMLVTLITHWWKVSVHATGIAGPVVALIYRFGGLAVPLYLFVPLVAWSRLALGKHTLGQVMVGTLIGTVSTAIQLIALF